MRHLGTLLAVLATLPLCACGLNLRLVTASVRKPSNVAVYFSVTHDDNEPVPDLDVGHFKIFEDDKLVSAYEAQQTILNPELAAIQYTLLLMDMSGSVLQSGALDDLVTAAGHFIDRVGKTQPVAVYAFDGSKDIFPILQFTTAGAPVAGAINALKQFKSRDPSTNLNGAVVQGLRVLARQMDRASQPLRFSSLVVFTDGSDRAKRVDRDDLMKALDDAKDTTNVFVIGVGAEIDESELHAIGRAGAVLSRKPAEMSQAFDHMAQKIEGLTHSFYLLSYCSPARAGEHDVRIEAFTKLGTGVQHWFTRSGSLTYHFNAAGFGPNCDSNTLPPFDMHRPRLDKSLHER